MVVSTATLLLTLPASGCHSDDPETGDRDGGQSDAEVERPDLNTGAKREYGAPCTSHTDCEGGFCMLESEKPHFVGGFCTSPCTADDNECASEETCQSTWGACIRSCINEACPAGLGCFVLGSACIPPLKQLFDATLLCDPTTRDNPNCRPDQICRRLEHADDGDGVDKGVCTDTCVVGEETCGEGNGACRLEANAALPTRTGQSTYQGDVGTAPVCSPIGGFSITANPAGSPCLFDSGGSTYTSSHACEDRAQCALSKVTVALLAVSQTLASNPDNLCHVLCYRDGTTPTISAPDGGQAGSPFTKCPDGTACTDAYGLFGNSFGEPQVGLCR